MATVNNINASEPTEVGAGGVGAATLTDHGVLIGSGTGAVTALAVGTNGQLLTGSTGADPVFYTVASASGTVSYTLGAGTLDMATEGGGLVWSEVTGTTQQMKITNGYLANNGSEVALTLPAAGSVGDRVSVAGKGSGKWRISQNSGQTIHLDDDDTTTGVGGYLTGDIQYACVEIVCITANTDWVVINSLGTLTAN